jgi:hypothetical protein
MKLDRHGHGDNLACPLPCFEEAGNCENKIERAAKQCVFGTVSRLIVPWQEQLDY